MVFLLSFLENTNGIASPIRGIAISAIENLNPMRDTIHAVTVVPILAPIITEMDSPKVNNPAFTKLTISTVVADEDCIIDVIIIPDNTPTNLFLVIDERIRRILFPATFCKDSLIIFIPKRNMPNAPISVNASKSPKLFISTNFI